MSEARTLDYREPDWLAEQLGVDKSTIYRYLQDGTLPGLQLGRKWLVSEKQVLEFLDEEVKRQTETRRRIRESGLKSTLAGFLSGSKDRFDKFTERARRVLTLAQEEAIGFNHNYIGTEHLLLGLIREGEGVGARVLVNLGVELERVRFSVESIIGRGSVPIDGEIALTPRAKKVLGLAVEEARGLNHHYIGTEHLLLGLIREGDGIAAGILRSLGPELDAVRAETRRVLAEIEPAGEAGAQS
jgi:excisionase family DNA binding protein